MKWALAFILMTTGCGSAEPRIPARTGVALECALGGASTFTTTCTIEKGGSAERIILTLSDPDGGFRRLFVDAAGRGVEAADGALPARVRRGSDGKLAIAIAGDRYRLPAAAP